MDADVNMMPPMHRFDVLVSVSASLHLSAVWIMLALTVIGPVEHHPKAVYDPIEP